MLFSSSLFLFLFLPILLVFYFLLPKKMRNIVLLIASLIFYAWGEPVYVGLMIFSSIVDYVLGLKVYEYKIKNKNAKIFVILSAIINLSLLGFFKYCDFLIGIINSVVGTNIPVLNLPLPIGISFYTFQTMSYTIDIYLGNALPQKNPLQLGVYVTMFPQLIAGPIVRYKDISEQITHRLVSMEKFQVGVTRFIIGLSKKVIIANNIGAIFEYILKLTDVGLATAWLGVFSFGMQIFFDFSGYSDMAIGLGKMFGFDFLENFNYPYISKNITEFWRRWHMSLGTWFRDYVYIPLRGNRCSKQRHIFNILLVWFLTGLWHGASWNFIIWGMYFAILLLLEKYVYGQYLKRLPDLFQHVYSLFFIFFGWIIFAIDDFSALTIYINNMFINNILIDETFKYLINNNYGFIILSIIFSIPIKVRNKSIFLIPMLIICIAYLVSDSFNPFLYFRF